jgi:hypothetical protein
LTWLVIEMPRLLNPRNGWDDAGTEVTDDAEKGWDDEFAGVLMAG